MIIDSSTLDTFVNASNAHPHGVLGMHSATKDKKNGVVVRAFLKDAVSCEVVEYLAKPEKRYSMKKIHDLGFFEVFIEDKHEVFPYRLRIEKANGEIRHCFDPYSFLPTLSEEDLYLFNEGTHYQIYKKLGAHVIEHYGVKGVAFAVWAPNAKRVSVVCDFNHWDGRYNPMRPLGASGIWELFIPGLESGVHYKYEMINANNHLVLKSDPYANFFESPPHNASITYDIGNFSWNDTSWIKRRSSTDWKKEPISIYELHLGSWKRIPEDNDRPLTYRELAPELAKYVKEMGYTHVEFMPLAEHPFIGSWGYQVTGFFAPTHRYGTPHDFMYLVDYLHQNNIGVIVDWVPAHFPKDAFALARFDGTALYEHEDPRKGEHKEWGTLVFNYGRHEVRSFLINSALAWLDYFHIDGFRVDAVASMLYLNYARKDGEWLPNQYGGQENIEAIEFLRTANDVMHSNYPGVITIAEESTAFGRVSWPTKDYGLGFDFKWNMGWMHDTLEYFKNDPLFRKDHHHKLTFGMLYQYSENYVLVYSHDEVVHGKGSMLMKMGSWYIRDKAHSLRALYAFMWAWPGKKTLFMGCDFGQSHEWYYDGSLDWHLTQYGEHSGLLKFVADLNKWYCGSPWLAKYDYNPLGFEWINTHDEANSVISFMRQGDNPNECILYIGNFTPVKHEQYRVGVPYSGVWKELLNSDAELYGGSGYGNLGQVTSEDIPWNARSFSLSITLPPLSSLIFKYQVPVSK